MKTTTWKTSSQVGLMMGFAFLLSSCGQMNADQLALTQVNKVALCFFLGKNFEISLFENKNYAERSVLRPALYI
jgi:hypothetical protein